MSDGMKHALYVSFDIEKPHNQVNIEKNPLR
jgi:hypothetical protein